MANKNKYDKYYVALGTPMKDDAFSIDYDAFRKHFKYFADSEDFVNAGGGIIVLPEAGEVFSMTRQEKQNLLKIAMEESHGQLPVFTGIASYNTAEIVVQAKDAQEIGVDGLFIMPPSGTIDITFAFDKFRNPYPFLNLAKAIAAEVDLPFIAHAVGPFDPKYGATFPIESIIKIAKEVPNFVGWKMMNSSIDNYLEVGYALREYEKETGHHIALLCAAAHLYYNAMTHNMIDGSVSCHWNYSRDENLKLINAWKAKDLAAMQKIWLDEGLWDLHYSMMSGIGLGGTRLHTDFKINTWLHGLIPNPFVRPPMVQPFKQEVTFYRDLRRKHNMVTISDEEINRVLEKLPSLGE